MKRTARCAPRVVDISVTAEIDTNFGRRSSTGEGAGFVLDTRGHIVTNEHAVEGATSIVVRLASGLKTRARLTGASASSDVAVLSVTLAQARLHPLVLGDSTHIRPGQPSSRSAVASATRAAAPQASSVPPAVQSTRRTAARSRAPSRPTRDQQRQLGRPAPPTRPDG